MLQQNNNNNYLCLDHAVLQDSQKSSVPFPSPLDFGDMSLIKTLRAWAKSGLSARTRGGTTSLHHHLAKSCQKSNGSAQGSGAPPMARPSTRGPPRGVAGIGEQAGLGALVTVAMLKASEGGRQTQTRCLLLKAEGQNYVCGVGGSSRDGTAASTAPSRATLVGSWIRDAVVGSKEVSGPKNTSRNGPCNGEVFRVKPRSAKKWRKLSNTAAMTTDMASNKQDHVNSPNKLQEKQLQAQPQQHQEQQGAKNKCVSTRLNAQGRKQVRGSAHRGNGRSKDRRGTARGTSKPDGLHEAVVLGRNSMDIIDVPCAELGSQTQLSNVSCAEHSSPTVKANLKKTWTDGSATGPGEAGQVVTEPSCQISHFTEPANLQEGKNISLHISCMADAQGNKSPERTSETVCSVQEKEQGSEDPTKGTLSSTWVSNLSPERHCFTELGLEKQHCCCKDLDNAFTCREDLPEPRHVEALNWRSLSETNPPYGCGCGDQETERGEELDGKVENGPNSNLNTVSPLQDRDEALQGLGNAEAQSGQNPDEAYSAAAVEDHGKEEQCSVRTSVFSEAGAGGGRDGVREQQDFRNKSADNNPPWTAPTLSNTAKTGVTPAVSSPAANTTTTTPTTSNATATTSNTVAHAHPNPAPPGAMATGLPGPERGHSEAETEPPSQEQPGQPRHTETHTADTVATICESQEGGGRGGQGDEELEEEDEFGGFMQAGKVPAWKEGFAEFHQVPCRNVAASDKGNMSSWQCDWTENPWHQTDDSWVAFSRDPDGQGSGEEIASGQWWPQTAVEDKECDFNAPRVFLEAFPPVSSMTFDLSGIPTLKQLLRGTVEQNRAAEDYGERSLLDGFQDLNKMFGLKHKRTESPSWKHLLASLQVDAPPSTHLKDLPQGHDLAAGHAVVSLQTKMLNKRRLSYDMNRNLLA